MGKMKNNHYLVPDICCCYLCKHAIFRTQLCLTCTNKKAWLKDTSVQPIANCRYFERKENTNGN